MSRDVTPYFKQPREKKPPKRLPTRSAKRRIQEEQYKRQRVDFLDRRPFCQLQVPGVCTRRSVEVQHLKGRIGPLLLDETHWAAACSPCHRYATANPAEAIAKGWAKKRGS